MNTKRNEIVKTLSNPWDMLGEFIRERLLRSWKEDFVDEDTGEVVSIDRYEVIAEKGERIDQDLMQSINFFLTSKDITEVVVSNQRREGTCVDRGYPNPYLVTVDVGDKKKKFLVYAKSVTMATEIVQDYLEQELKQAFFFVSVKEYDNAIILEDDFEKNDLADIKFYQMDVKVMRSDEQEFIQTYIVHTSDTERALGIIKDFIVKKKDSTVREIDNVEYTLMIETSKILPCSKFIPVEFTNEYLKK